MTTVPDLKKLVEREGPRNYWGFLLVRRKELREFLERLFNERNHLDILEIGCYKGMLVGWLHENFPRPTYSWNYWGIDIVEPPDRRRDYSHLIMNAEALEFPANRFDVVLMIEVLEHIVDYVRALREVYRVLKPGGAVFIQSVVCTDPCALSDESHFHVLHPKILKRLLEWIGFRGVEYVEGGNFAIWGFK